MSELAFNINGEAFEVPPNATGWRVRRMRAKGSPEVVYGRDGMPLVLPIDAELDDLRSEVNTSGRYRLDLVDQNNKAITDMPSGYVQVYPEAAPAPAGGSSAIASVLPKQPSDNIVIEALRTQSAMALAVIERFPQMMDSAANLLRAADGAGLPARLPASIEVDEVEEEAVAAAAPKNEWIPFLQGLMPFAFELFKGSNLKLPGGLGALFDCRRAVPKAANDEPEVHSPRPSAPKKAAAVNAKAAGAPATSKTDASDDDAKLPPLDPSTMAHFLAIQNELAPNEAALAQEVAANLGPAEVRAWFQELRTLSVPDAVAKIRGLIGTKEGRAS